MVKKIIKNDNIDEDLWITLLKESPYSSPFNTPGFFSFFNSLDGFSADVFAVPEGNKYSALVVVTTQKERGVKSFFSKRGIVYGGIVLLDKTDKSQVNELLSFVRNYYKNKLIYLEIRNYFNYNELKEVFYNNGFIYKPWLNFHLDTSDEQQMRKRISSSRLRQIKKALKSGVEWKEATEISKVEDYYKILSDLYKNKIKKPLFPKEFFTEFLKHNVGKYLLVYYENKVIGGIMCPIFKGKTIYEFYVCGLDREYKNQYPSVMATWAAMEYAVKNGIPLFDFMGAGSPDENYGVRDFKARFGGKEVEYGRFVSVLNPVLYKTGVLGLKLLSKIK